MTEHCRYGEIAMDQAAPQMGKPVEGSLAGSSGSPAAVTDNRKVVRYASLSLETKEFDNALAQIRALIEQSGGYIENESVSGVSIQSRDRYNERSASISARIPAEKLDEVTSSVGGVCNVLNRSENASDITDSYFDSQARLDSLTLQEERLLDILPRQRSSKTSSSSSARWPTCVTRLNR
jgi:hypothetical protein